MPFLIQPLEKSVFQNLFDLSSAELAPLRAVKMIATSKPGFPCRVSLADAEIGEELILIHYEHQPAHSPFRASHAVFVRRAADQAKLRANEVPPMLRSRTLSLRAFDKNGMMTAADLVEGPVLEGLLEEMLAEANVSYVHIHFAKPGCYAACATRP
jgi:hypothetical protein